MISTIRQAATVALNHKEIGKIYKQNKKLSQEKNKYNWKGINDPPGINDWEVFEKNNETVDVNILYIKNEKIHNTYVSKHNSIQENQIILLMISENKTDIIIQ